MRTNITANRATTHMTLNSAAKTDIEAARKAGVDATLALKEEIFAAIDELHTPGAEAQ
jgi:hypothetical protein